ncbi:P-II family nitrogen regulator [Salinisphaera hydrothermalis]|uniref:Nitrogen regulatory protein PII-like protein n=1 Tax=Salinisphaera hydrothermalis (strain C41B8) TaxID=1304275 RepID=A0A084IGV4_SALHC|nr:P-II family nitrogen regulator [Salinisphaera hydrothermalis]KEZ75938.1 nitrogen regulatory protein PII-like protein [Salinisphaera hydrothermalis C41B8]
MKEIKAYIRAHRTDAVIDALTALPDLPAIAVVPLKEIAHGVDGGRLRTVDMVKLEIDVADAQVEPVVDALLAAARTGAGHPGDGKIQISDVAASVDIASGRRV